MPIYLTPLDCAPDSHLKTILGLSPAIFVHCSAKTPITPSADWRLLIQGHPSIHLSRQAATKQWHKDMNIASRWSEDTFCDGCISNEAPPSGIHNETHWFSTNPQITAQKQAILLQKTRRSFGVMIKLRVAIALDKCFLDMRQKSIWSLTKICSQQSLPSQHLATTASRNGLPKESLYCQKGVSKNDWPGSLNGCFKNIVLCNFKNNLHSPKIFEIVSFFTHPARISFMTFVAGLPVSGAGGHVDSRRRQ